MKRVVLWNFHIEMNENFAGTGFICEKHDPNDDIDVFLPVNCLDNVDFIIAVLRDGIDTLARCPSPALIDEIERTLQQIARIRRKPVPVLFVTYVEPSVLSLIRHRSTHSVTLHDGVAVTVIDFGSAGEVAVRRVHRMLKNGAVPIYDVQKRYPYTPAYTNWLGMAIVRCASMIQSALKAVTGVLYLCLLLMTTIERHLSGK